MKPVLAHLTKAHFTLLRKWGRGRVFGTTSGKQRLTKCQHVHVSRRQWAGASVWPSLQIHSSNRFENGFTELVLCPSQERDVVFAPEGVIVTLWKDGNIIKSHHASRDDSCQPLRFQGQDPKFRGYDDLLKVTEIMRAGVRTEGSLFPDQCIFPSISHLKWKNSV